ncbi:hypothetical protein [Nocardia sp. CNY236]|uniref:hypothetical protein n=1 Tax=Nocardia sp. CNY236 TaxID=1169152 RepID=UPI0004087927|nr:hypothetical protein [Nocardia sp. CNY236]
MTDDPFHVPIAELRRLLDIVLSHIEAATNSPAVDLEKDYFWSIPPDALYDVYKSPADLTIGQLSESWQNARGLLADPGKVIGYDLVFLSDVLRAIGHGATG